MGIFRLEIRVIDKDRQIYQAVTEGVASQQVTFLPYATFVSDVERLYARKRLGNSYVPDDKGYLDLTSQERACTQIGEQLFTSFLPGPIGQSFRQSHANSPPRIAVHLPRCLYN